MDTSSVWFTILSGLGTDIVAAIIGVAFVFFVRDGLINRWRFSGWKVRLFYEGEDVMPERSISWRKAKEIDEDPAHRSVFLKGVASPFARFHCDIITEGYEKGLLLIETKQKPLFGREQIYTFDLKKGHDLGLLTIEQKVVNRVIGDERIPPPGRRAEEAAPPETAAGDASLLLNFAHPLTPEHVAAVERLAGRPVGAVRDEPTQSFIDNSKPLTPQVAAIVDGLGLTPREWQNAPILVNLPGYAPAAAVLLAELHGRMGHFPAVVRLRPVPQTTPTLYEVAEIVNLSALRAAARHKRRN